MGPEPPTEQDVRALAGQLIRHYDTASPEYARSLAEVVASLHRLGPAAAAAAGVPAETPDEQPTSRHEPRLADRCEDLLAAGPLGYALFALASGAPEHRAAAAAQLRP